MSRVPCRVSFDKAAKPSPNALVVERCVAATRLFRMGGVTGGYASLTSVCTVNALAYNFVLFTNLNCSQLPFVNNSHVILIYIPVRSTGGGLSGQNGHDKRVAFDSNRRHSIATDDTRQTTRDMLGWTGGLSFTRHWREAASRE